MVTNVSAILFDLGGVLYHINDKVMIDEFNKLGNQDFSEIYNLSTQKPIIDKYEMGFVSSEEFFSSLKIYFSESVREQELVTAWNSMLLGMPEENFKLLLELKKNYPIYLLSNTNHEHIKFINHEMDNIFNVSNLKNLFDDVIYSYEVNMRKPDTDIYDYTLSKIPYQKENILYIEDNLANYNKGKELGINSVFMLRNSNLNTFINSLNLTF